LIDYSFLWNGNKCGKTDEMNISRYSSSTWIIRDKKKVENVECFNYLASMITVDFNP
jgi:hypothetical protein